MKLAIKNINKKFSKKIVLNNVSFTVSTGEIVALIGRNGSGKTTLLKILSGIYSQDSGKIKIEGVDNKNIKKQLIYIPDRFDYFKNSKIKRFYGVGLIEVDIINFMCRIFSDGSKMGAKKK